VSEWIIVRNWDRFQHYKDRRPPWIKLYDSILDDEEFVALQPIARLVLIGIWQLYGRRNGRLSARPKYIRDMLSLPRSPAQQIDQLVKAGFIDVVSSEPQEGLFTEWASRYVPDALRAEIFHEANNICQGCFKEAAQEIDHIVPISKGGTGEKSNLQALCRHCNRSKNNRDLSSIGLDPVLPETEEDKEKTKAVTSYEENGLGFDIPRDLLRVVP
jgi:hypothetical protein